MSALLLWCISLCFFFSIFHSVSVCFSLNLVAQLCIANITPSNPLSVFVSNELANQVSYDICVPLDYTSSPKPQRRDGKIQATGYHRVDQADRRTATFPSLCYSQYLWRPHSELPTARWLRLFRGRRGSQAHTAQGPLQSKRHLDASR